MTLTKNSEEVKDFAALINLPPGWCWIPFEEITINYDGKRIPITSSARKPGVFRYYGASGIIDYVDDYLFDGDYLLIAEDGANLLSRSTPIAFEANGKFWVNNHAHIVQVPGELIPLSYLKEYFNFTDLRFYISGSAQPKLNQKNLNRIEIPLAPLNEQRRIVAKIEAVKARSQRVKEELDAIAPLLDQFRQSVLAAAFRGDLTTDWREKNPDVEPATRVLESLREKRFSQARTPAQLQKLNEIYSSQEEEDSNLLPESWRYIALEKLCDSFQYGTSAKSLASGKVPVLRMGNIQNGEIDWSDLVYTSDEDEIEKYKLKIGDVLFNRTNSPELVGKTGIYRGEHQAIFAGYLIKINNTQELDSEYLNYCLNTGYAKEYCWRVKTDGVSQSNINAQKLGKFELPFCSLEEQRKVVRRINSLFLVANRLKQNYKEAKAYLDQLDRSILAKAFRGELVPQDPNDEPASVLLERIRAERENLDTKKKAKGKTEKKSRKAKPEATEPKQLSLPGFE